MTGRHAGGEARPGDGLVRAGAAVFGVGALGMMLVLAAFLVGSDDVPLESALVATLMPLGLGLALIGLLRGARSRR